MNAEQNVVPVRPKDSVSFQCSLCGGCCRGVKDGIMLEPLDIFRLGRYLRAREAQIEGTEDVLSRYAHPSMLNGLGLPIFLLNTEGPEDACVFLRDGRCAVYEARPRVCRLYPFTVAPGERGRNFEYLLCTERPHHFGAGRVLVNDWLYANFPKEERRFLKADFDGLAALGRILRGMKEDRRKETLFPLLLYRYYDYDLEKPFLPQFFSNLEALKQALEKGDC